MTVPASKNPRTAMNAGSVIFGNSSIDEGAAAPGSQNKGSKKRPKSWTKSESSFVLRELEKIGAQRQNRTADTRLFRALLYRLSYLGTSSIDDCEKCSLGLAERPQKQKAFPFRRATAIPLTNASKLALAPRSDTFRAPEALCTALFSPSPCSPPPPRPRSATSTRALLP